VRAVPWGTGLDTGYIGRREFTGVGGGGDKFVMVAGGCFDLVVVPCSWRRICFWAQSGHFRRLLQCSLLTQSGHWLLVAQLSTINTKVGLVGSMGEGPC
jgi:hypothetical protein